MPNDPPNPRRSPTKTVPGLIPLQMFSLHIRHRIARPTCLALLTLSLCLPALKAASPTIGLPITRIYSTEEIGASRGPQLSFDRLGRLAVISSGSYIVLNDDSWIDLAIHNTDILPMLELAVDSQGTAYYGALASWGIAETTRDGLLRPKSLRPEQYPAWVNAMNFTQILFTPTGVLFAGTNGVVHLNTATMEQSFFEIPVATAFTLNSEIYLSSSSYGTVRFDPQSQVTEVVSPDIGIFRTARFGENGIVAATNNNRLAYFDGTKLTERDFGFGDRRLGTISCLEPLPDGGFAVAMDGEGLFLVDGDGERKMALTTTNYRRILDLAVRDTGILWVARESSVEKLLYNNPVSVVDHRSDVVIGWPQVLQRGGHSLIASNGLLYKMEPSANSWRYEFKSVENLPFSGVWGIATNEDHLLVGNADGVYAQVPGGFELILGNIEANRVFFQDQNTCVVVGSTEIAAIRWDGQRWFECAPRIPGIGFPSIAHRTDEALWIELGLDRVARLWFEKDEIQLKIIDQFPWDEPVWVNIGILNEYVVLSGPDNQRVYLDKATAQPVATPAIDSSLRQSENTVLRVTEDKDGVIWATHAKGVLTIHPTENGYRMDSDSLLSISDQYPVITLINGQDAWIATESALYHVDQAFQPLEVAPRQPFLVSIADGKTGNQLYSAHDQDTTITDLPYSQNHLVFRYFSGGYTPLEEPIYEFSMQKGSESWKVYSEDSLLTLPSLEEGKYQLTAQLTDGDKRVGDPILTSFQIDPPWYRSTLAYAMYWGVGILSCLSIMAIGFRRAKKTQDQLELLVQQRTEELRETMQKLTDEARTSATLAERNRLAGEIHDSLQQGLSGIALQLDATLKHDNLESNLLNRLSIARRMVSYTRQEVQQAVWDLESPLLHDENLGEALRNIAQLLEAGEAKLSLRISDTTIEIPSRTKHHILRIAQEAIANAIRHSKAKHISVLLAITEDDVTLEVKDDGKGFDPNEIFTEGLGHFGLRGLRTRAAKVDGELKIDSKPDQGTCIHISIPLTTHSN